MIWWKELLMGVTGGGRSVCPDYRPGGSGGFRRPDPYGPVHSLVRGRGGGGGNPGKSHERIRHFSSSGQPGGRRFWNIRGRICGSLGHGADGDYQYHSHFCLTPGPPPGPGASGAQHGAGPDHRLPSLLLLQVLSTLSRQEYTRLAQGRWRKERTEERMEGR